MKGKIIVMGGSDASGKATQAKLLVKKLLKEGFKAELMSFPQYNRFFGKLVKKYLQGKFGSIKEVPVEIAALLYTLDRYDAKKEIEKKLEQGKILVLDRYSESNFGHQTAKISSKKKQAEFLRWIKTVESRLPKPDLIFFLDMPIDISQKLLKRKKDIHEKNIAYLKKTRTVFLHLAKTQPKWVTINCVEKQRIKSRKEIHSQIWEKTKKIL